MVFWQQKFWVVFGSWTLEATLFTEDINFLYDYKRCILIGWFFILIGQLCNQHFDWLIYWFLVIGQFKLSLEHPHSLQPIKIDALWLVYEKWWAGPRVSRSCDRKLMASVWPVSFCLHWEFTLISKADFGMKNCSSLQTYGENCKWKHYTLCWNLYIFMTPLILGWNSIMKEG